MHLSILAAVLGLAGTGSALMPVKPMKPPMHILLPDDGDNSKPSTGTPAYFDQLIDHSRPELGTFKQRYYYNTDYYKGPGHPISMESPSESPLEGDVALTNITMPGFIAQQIGGATVSIEHRFYGESNPFGRYNHTAEDLQHLTLDNAIKDLTYFARNVKLPFDPEGLSHPDKAPWTLAGCSYSGGLSAWTQRLDPGTFWAHEAGSAVVEAREDLWTWYVGAEAAMPRNCSADFHRIVAHVDNVYINGNESAKQALRTYLGHDERWTYAESAQEVSGWIGRWQGQQYKTGYGPFFQMCDYIENQHPGSTEPMPGADGVGLEKALAGLLRGWKEVPEQERGDPRDFEPWLWQLCNEPFEWWQSDRPGRPFGMVSRMVTEEYLIKQVCGGTFPDVDGYTPDINKGKTATDVNRHTGGWDYVDTERLVWVNADRDPWLYATVSSPDRPGGALQSTDKAPVYMLRGAAHCNDYVTGNYGYNEDATKMFDGVAAYMKKWTDEFYTEKGIERPQ